MLSVSALPSLACTSLVFKAQDGTGIYARTMEWGASDLNSELVLAPHSTSFASALGDGKTGMSWKNSYGFVGVNAAGLPYATDGMNEAGLTVGVLFYPGFAQFQEPSPNQLATTISSVDVANYLLSNFKTVEEVRQAMPKVRVVRNAEIEKAFGTPIPIDHIVTDAAGASMVIEYTNGALTMFDNKVGAMTNSPVMIRLVLRSANYANLRRVGAAVAQHRRRLARAVRGGQRNARAAGRLHAAIAVHPRCGFRKYDGAGQGRRRRGCSGRDDVEQLRHSEGPGAQGASPEDFHLGYTQWSVIADTRHKVYYYWTMYDRRMRSVDFGKLNFDAPKVSSFPLDRVRTEDIEDRSSDFAH